MNTKFIVVSTWSNRDYSCVMNSCLLLPHPVYRMGKQEKYSHTQVGRQQGVLFFPVGCVMGLGHLHSCQEVGWHHRALGSSEKSSLFSLSGRGSDLIWGGLQTPSPHPPKGDDSLGLLLFEDNFHAPSTHRLVWVCFPSFSKMLRPGSQFLICGHFVNFIQLLKGVMLNTI